MTDQTVPDSTDPGSALDKYLSVLVDEVDARVDPVDKDQFPVTLMVPGGIITGSLVPQWQYARNIIPPVCLWRASPVREVRRRAGKLRPSSPGVPWARRQHGAHREGALLHE